MTRRQQGVGYDAESAPEGGDQKLPVERPGYGLSYPAVGEDRVFQIYPDVAVIRTRVLANSKGGIVAKGGNQVGRQAVDDELYGSLAQLECANGGVGNLTERDAVDRRAPIEVVLESRQLDPIWTAGLDSEGPRAVRRTGELFRRDAIWNNPEKGVQIHQERAVGLREDEIHGVGVHRFDPCHFG